MPSLALTSLPCQLFFLEVVDLVRVVLIEVVAMAAAADMAEMMTTGAVILLKPIVL